MGIEINGTGTTAICDHPGCDRTEFVDDKVGEWPEKRAELHRRGWTQDAHLFWRCPAHSPRAA